MGTDVLQPNDYTAEHTAQHTAEEAFWLNPSGSWELIDGRFVFMSPSGVRHGHLVVRISRALSEFAESRDLGVVLAGDVGFVLRRKPDAVRAPDVAFVRTARVASGLPAEFFEGAPDLAVEVMSPGDRWPEVERKAREFLAAGAVAVWAIDPEQRIACAYGAEADRHLGSDDSLSCPALLGDFKLALRDLW